MNKLYFICLVSISLLFSLIQLDHFALMDFDEATYAKVYHEASMHNNFLSFTYLNQQWFEKPPLYFWTIKAVSTFLGENEFSLRLPSSLLTSLSILLVFLITLKITKNQTSAYLSSIILLTTAYFLYSGRQLRLDIPVTATILLSFYFFLKARDNSRWFILFGLSIASSILFKSIIGLLIYPIIILFSFFYHDFTWLKKTWFWVSIVLTFLLILPWHMYETVHFGTAFWNIYLFHQVLDRVTTMVTSGANTPFLYYIQELFIVCQPWFFTFILATILFLFTTKNKRKDYAFELFTLITTIAIFILFYIPQTKLLYYFIPMLPFMAMFLGSYSLKLYQKSKVTMGIILFILITLGLIHTLLTIFSEKDRDFFLQESQTISRYTVANDEKRVAIIASEQHLPLYTYAWQFYSTLFYYSHNISLARLTRSTHLLYPPLLILLPTPLITQQLYLPLPKDAKTEIIFQGEAATLVKATL